MAKPLVLIIVNPTNVAQTYVESFPIKIFKNVNKSFGHGIKFSNSAGFRVILWIIRVNCFGGVNEQTNRLTDI